MESYDRYNPNEPNDYDSASSNDLERLKLADRGYAFVYRKVERKDGKLRRKKIEFYASGDFGSNIRDAVSGQYCPQTVGSLGEHLFFKLGFSTGEFKTKNGSNTLFFLSPEQYEKHFLIEVPQHLKDAWVEKQLYYKSLLNEKKEKKQVVIK